jgi:hypothetical protein
MGAAAGAAGAASSVGTGAAAGTAGSIGAAGTTGLLSQAGGVGMSSGGAGGLTAGGLTSMGTMGSGLSSTAIPSVLSGNSGASFGGSAISNSSLANSIPVQSSIDWKGKLKEMLSKTAEDKINDLNYMQFPQMSKPQNNEGYNESALKQGFKNSDLYNKLMQEQVAQYQAQQVKRYNQGV